MKKPSNTDPSEVSRCPWCEGSPLMKTYHDEEWGVPVHDDRKHFEFLVLESAQAGLSWSTILAKRAGYRKAFAAFDPVRVARMTEADVARLCLDPGIVRNRLKIAATIGNAARFLEVQREWGTFDRYIWSFVDGKPLQNRWSKQSQVPVTSQVSDALSKDLKKRGFKFVGSTTMYAHMQAIGLVNDHITSCFRFAELRSKA